MKAFKYFVLLAGFACLYSCKSEDVETVLPTGLENLTATANPGSITLSWDYPEGEVNNRYIEIKYHDYRKGKDVVKSISSYAKAFIVENTLQRDGEYIFTLQPFSTSFTPGKIYTVSQISGKAPATESFESQELAITEDNINLYGVKPDGTLLDNPIADSNVPENLFDGDLKTRLGCQYNGVPIGTIFYFTVDFPKSQQFLKFSYNTPHAGWCPIEIECLVKANPDDEWTLIETLTQSEDGLPVDNNGTLYTSKEIKSPFEFNYFCFRVTKTQQDKVNFSLAEFRIFDVTYSYYDPEAEPEVEG